MVTDLHEQQAFPIVVCELDFKHERAHNTLKMEGKFAHPRKAHLNLVPFLDSTFISKSD